VLALGASITDVFPFSCTLCGRCHASLAGLFKLKQRTLTLMLSSLRALLALFLAAPCVLGQGHLDVLLRQETHPPSEEGAAFTRSLECLYALAMRHASNSACDCLFPATATTHHLVLDLFMEVQRSGGTEREQI
jgi:hypothetical protein